MSSRPSVGAAWRVHNFTRLNTLGRKHGSLAVEVSHSWKIGDIDGAA